MKDIQMFEKTIRVVGFKDDNCHECSFIQMGHEDVENSDKCELYEEPLKYGRVTKFSCTYDFKRCNKCLEDEKLWKEKQNKN